MIPLITRRSSTPALRVHRGVISPQAEKFAQNEQSEDGAKDFDHAVCCLRPHVGELAPQFGHTVAFAAVS